MTARIFSKEDDSVLEELYSSFTNKELVKLFNGQFSRDQIKNRAKALGLRKDKTTIARSKTGAWKEWEKEIIRRHYPKGGKEACQKFLTHRSLVSITHKAVRMGINLDYDAYCERKANGPSEHSKESKRKMSEARKGVPKSEDFKRKMSEIMAGENHPNWQGGKSFEEYPPEFNEPLKRKIRSRDKHRCQRCGKIQKGRNLSVHHIDYDKQNCSPSNLISLCIDCHNKHHLKLSEAEMLNEQEFFKTILATK